MLARLARIAWWIGLTVWWGLPVAHAQRVQFPSASPSAPLTPMPPAPMVDSGAMLGGTIQPFDPYALPGNLGQAGVAPYAGPPGWPGPAPSALPSGVMGPSTFAAPPPVPGWGQPYGTPLPPTTGLGQPRPNNPYYQGSPYASGATNPAPTSGPPYSRLFQDTGLTATHLFGDDGSDLAMTEVEASTTAYFANFLNIPNGLRVTPGFIFHWTDGPSPPETSDVPSRLYSAYLDFAINPRWTANFGADISARVGAYSDFQEFNEDSLRFQTMAVGIWQCSPASAIKLGVNYVDRVNIKLLPAFGWLWTPNKQTRWDIFFPSPKLANYWTTVGNQQVWWYLGGEYGGGSWTIEREGPPAMGDDDRLDINDIRAFVGVEWWSLNRAYGFFEVGYVFERQLVYYHVPSDSMDLGNTWMVRGGISW